MLKGVEKDDSQIGSQKYLSKYDYVNGGQS
jgi:hypothetical protein